MGRVGRVKGAGPRFKRPQEVAQHVNSPLDNYAEYQNTYKGCDITLGHIFLFNLPIHRLPRVFLCLPFIF